MSLRPLLCLTLFLCCSLICTAKHNMERTVFTNGQTYLCNKEFDASDLKLMAFDTKHNELFVAASDKIFEVAGFDLNNSIQKDIKEWVSFESGSSFDTKVLKYHSIGKDKGEVIICGSLGGGSCFRMSTNLKFKGILASKSDMNFGNAIYSNLHADLLFIANNRSGAPSFITAYNINEFPTSMTISFVDDVDFEVVGSFHEGAFSYFVLNRVAEARILRTCNGADSNALVELKLTCQSEGEIFERALLLAISEGNASNIFMVFTKSQSTEAAFCHYHLSDIKKEFESVVSECFNNPTAYSPSRVSKGYLDRATEPCSSEMVAGWSEGDFCHKGDLSIYSDSVVRNHQAFLRLSQVPSALLVIKLKQHHVAFLTLGSSLIKLKMPFVEEKVEEYSTTNFNESGTVISMLFDNYDDLFVLTDSSVCKVEQALCQYDECYKCVADPHCGWCPSLSKKKCTLKFYCIEETWMNDKCPKITQISPSTSTLQSFPNQKFSLSSINMPEDFDTLQCLLRQQDAAASVRVVSAHLEAGAGAHTFSCEEFPRIRIDQPAQDVEVGLLFDGVEWATSIITVYDCNRFSSCMSCLSDVIKYPCVWCISSHKCQNNQDACPPSINTDDPQSLQVMEMCPHILPQPDTKSLYASGSIVSYSLKTPNLLKGFSPLECRFRVDGEGEVLVRGNVMENSMRDTVKCEGAKLSYTSNQANINVSVDLLTQNKKAIDNPQNIQVTLYKCEEMEKTCGKCGLLSEEYACVWCVEEDGGEARRDFCSVRESCKSPFPTAQTCPNPKITNFFPPGGPVGGGTNLTIEGENLGTRAEDVEVFVGNLLCIVIKELYVATERVVCKTPRQSSLGQAPVLVRVAGIYNATSRSLYDVNAPTLTRIEPTQGIMAGGTRVNVYGSKLNYGSDVRVLFAGKEAQLVQRSEDHLVVISPAVFSLQKVKVGVSVDASRPRHPNNAFEYVNNPSNLDYNPNESLLSGGSRIKLEGDGLKYVQNVTLEVYTSAKQPYVSPECTYTDEAFFCSTPRILNPDDQDRFLRTHNVKFKLDNYIFPSDGEYRSMKYYNDPEFIPIPANTSINNLQDDFAIQFWSGSRCLPEMVNEMKVFVGGADCGAVKCSHDNKKLLFSPQACPVGDEGGDLDVKVVFNNLNEKVGKVRFPQRGLKAGLIIGLVFGLLLGLSILFLVLFFLYKRKWQPTKASSNRPPGLDTVNNQASVATIKENPYKAGPGSQGEQTPLSQDYLNPSAFLNDEQYLNALLERLDNQNIRNAAKEIYIARERLELGNQLGKGHFGKVHAATLRDADLKNPCLVAVKTIDDPDMDQKMVEGFLKEGVIMKNFNHPHVLNLIGLCLGYRKEPMVVLPFMANGDLRSYVKDKKRSFTARQLLKLAQQVAEGMSYLASLNFIHRDLAARNCMIDDKSQVKVADFGLSHQLHDSEYYSSKNRKAKLPIKWMALESLENYVFTTKSDVWSFGVLLWELMTRGVTPYPDVDVFETRNYLATARRLYKPKFCPDNVYTIMTDCWQELPERRPTFTDLVNRIEVLLNPPRTKTDKGAQATKEPTYINVKDQEYMQDYLKPNVSAGMGDDAARDDAVVVDSSGSSDEDGGGRDAEVLLSADKKAKRGVEAVV